MSGKAKVLDRAIELLSELKTIVHHPNAGEIFLNGWLHDGDLPVPSVELILFLSGRFLTGSIVEDSATRSEDVVIKEALAFMRQEPDEIVLTKLREFLPNLRAAELDDSDSKDPFRHEWLPLIYNFCFPSSEFGVAHQAGTRILARRFLESLFLRSLFTMDAGRLQSAAGALRLISSGGDPRTTNARRFAALILRERPVIERELGFAPSKEQVKHLIRECIDGLPNDSKAWTAACKMVPWPKGDRRTKRLTRNQISALVMKFRKRMNQSEL